MLGKAPLPLPPPACTKKKIQISPLFSLDRGSLPFEQREVIEFLVA